MPPHNQSSRTSGNSALLDLNKVKSNSEKLGKLDLNNLILTAIRTLAGENQKSLETAAAKVKNSSDRLMSSEISLSYLESTNLMVKDALEIALKAIERLKKALKLLGEIWISEENKVRVTALEVIGNTDLNTLERKQPRRISRELALLSLSQIKADSQKAQKEDLNKLVLEAIKTLAGETQEIIETATTEVKRAQNRISIKDPRIKDLESAKIIVKDALELAETAINRIGSALELPEFIQISNQQEVKKYAIELITTVLRKHQEIDRQITEAIVNWQFNRLAQIDRDILRIAVAEILFLDISEKVAINEAVELAQIYSDEEGYRFINGVLRRVTDILKSASK
jgi:transcription antitermination protein NusB